MWQLKGLLGNISWGRQCRHSPLAFTKHQRAGLLFLRHHRQFLFCSFHSLLSKLFPSWKKIQFRSRNCFTGSQAVKTTDQSTETIFLSIKTQLTRQFIIYLCVTLFAFLTSAVIGISGQVSAFLKGLLFIDFYESPTLVSVITLKCIPIKQ